MNLLDYIAIGLAALTLTVVIDGLWKIRNGEEPPLSDDERQPGDW